MVLLRAAIKAAPYGGCVLDIFKEYTYKYKINVNLLYVAKKLISLLPGNVKIQYLCIITFSRPPYIAKRKMCTAVGQRF